MPSGDGGSMYSVMFYSRDKKPGYGQVNRGAYSNPEVDALIDKADSTSKIEERDKHLQDVTKILLEDIPMIPIHYERSVWSHFQEDVGSYQEAFNRAGLQDKVRWLTKGQRTRLEI